MHKWKCTWLFEREVVRTKSNVNKSRTCWIDIIKVEVARGQLPRVRVIQCCGHRGGRQIFGIRAPLRKIK
jgi:hypothetical protein